MSRRFSYKNRIKHKLMKHIFNIIVFIIIIIIVYLYFDSQSTKEYLYSNNESVINYSYKLRFKSLVDDINNNKTTGIPSYDDANIILGEKIEITPGYGDFVNLKSDQQYYTKSIGYHNCLPVNSTSIPILYNDPVISNSTFYDRSGVTKLLDRYTFSAVGTYWKYIFNNTSNRGSTYRVYTDTGIYYDIICVDTKSTENHDSDSTSVNTPNGKYSICHYKGGTSNCVTEIYRLNFDKNYPTYTRSGVTTIYPDKENLKNDVTHIEEHHSMNNIPEFKGNVIAIQKIEDKRVEDILKQSVEETGNSLV